MKDHDKHIEEQTKNALDSSIENLSNETLRRLTKVRIEATQAKAHPLPIWQTASAFSLLFVVALAWQLWPSQAELPLEPFADVLQEDLDMLEELEFVYWMAEESEYATL